MSLEETWLERYQKARDLVERDRDILVGFNANIDVVFNLDEIDLEPGAVEPEEKEKVNSKQELEKVLAHCVRENENREVEIEKLDHELGPGSERIGGQAGIIANYASGLGNGVIFYTPFLSRELAEKINERVLYPLEERGDFLLKNVRDAVNAERIKKNLIFEYGSGRLIASRKMKGFGPYFRKGVEKNLDLIDRQVDAVIVSGFHDVEGNQEAKLRKSAGQLEKLETDIHLEFVFRNQELTEKVFEHVVPAVDSLGLDEDELLHVSETFGMEAEKPLSLGESFDISRRLMDRFRLDRIHLHTYRYHLGVASESYRTGKEDIRDAMLFGELSAIRSASTGKIPGRKELSGPGMDDKHFNGFEEMRDFQDFFGLEDFTATGLCTVEGKKVVAIPALIHENPERLVGLGDIISSGAFMME